MRRAVFLVSTLAISVAALDAAALDTRVSRRLVVEGSAGDIEFGMMSVMAIGPHGDDCDYVADIAYPTNPNVAVVCMLRERRTAFAPNCIVNETANVMTVLEAGPHATGGGTPCAGYNLKGDRYDSVSLLLTESPNGVLDGIQFIDVGGGLQLFYPIKST